MYGWMYVVCHKSCEHDISRKENPIDLKISPKIGYSKVKNPIVFQKNLKIIEGISMGLKIKKNSN